MYNTRKLKLELRTLLYKAMRVALSLSLVTIEVLRKFLRSIESQDTEERQLHDSDISGELNYRTGRLDAGTDHYGWYDD